MSYRVPREFNEEELDLESEFDRIAIQEAKTMPVAPRGALPMPSLPRRSGSYTPEQLKKFANIEKIKFELDVAKAQRKADEDLSRRLKAVRDATSKRSGGRRKKRTRKGRKGKKGKKTRRQGKRYTRRH